MAKRILLVAQNFYPEFFKSNDIASELVARGHKVDVLTGIPNYPEGVFPKGYGVFKKRVDNYKGAKVYRAFQIPRGRKASGIRLAINYMSFAFTTTFWVLFFFLFKKRYDAIIIHQTSPVTQAWPGIILGKLRRIPIYTWVLDIWPDSMQAGGVTNKRVLACVDMFVQWMYRSSKKILISSEDFRALVNRKTNYDDKIIHFPNWCDDMLAMEKPKVEKLPDGFKIMMAGNLGNAQDIRTVMKAVLLTKEYKDIKWVFVGAGSEKEYIDKFVEEHHLEDTVYMTGRRPFSEMPSYFNQANAMLLTLCAGQSYLEAVVPARLQSYMSAGKPVIGMVDGGSTTVINKSICGICGPAGDYETLANNVLYAYDHKDELKEMGANGRTYYEEFFTMKLCLDNLNNIINQ